MFSVLRITKMTPGKHLKSPLTTTGTKCTTDAADHKSKSEPACKKAGVSYGLADDVVFLYSVSSKTKAGASSHQVCPKNKSAPAAALTAPPAGKTCFFTVEM